MTGNMEGFLQKGFFKRSLVELRHRGNRVTSFEMTVDALKLLKSECALKPGAVPDALAHAGWKTPLFEISDFEFLFKMKTGLKFYYRQGVGVTYVQPETVSDAEVTLFFRGSVFGAIAWINGFVPLHASAVVHSGTVHAFSGVSGAGKSTLAAALGKRGFPLMADDVLVLDLRGPDQITCLPGHKQMKLWKDALELTGMTAGSQVRPQFEKFYVRPCGDAALNSLPLGEIFFLTDHSDAPCLTPILGFERFTRATAAFYRPKFCDAVVEKRDLFAIAERLSQSVSMTVFDRPRGQDVFDHVADYIADAIRSESGN